MRGVPMPPHKGFGCLRRAARDRPHERRIGAAALRADGPQAHRAPHRGHRFIGRQGHVTHTLMRRKVFQPIRGFRPSRVIDLEPCGSRAGLLLWSASVGSS